MTVRNNTLVRLGSRNLFLVQFDITWLYTIILLIKVLYIYSYLKLHNHFYLKTTIPWFYSLTPFSLNYIYRTSEMMYQVVNMIKPYIYYPCAIQIN